MHTQLLCVWQANVEASVSSACLELFLRRTCRETLKYIGSGPCAESASQDRGSSRSAGHARYRDAGCVFVHVTSMLVRSTPTPCRLQCGICKENERDGEVNDTALCVMDCRQATYLRMESKYAHPLS